MTGKKRGGRAGCAAPSGCQKRCGLLFVVEVDEAPVEDDAALVIGEIAELQGEGGYAAVMDEECGNDFLLLLHCGADAGHKDEVAVGDGLLDAGLAEERQHAPVDEVGAVALGGIFHCDVRPGPQHTLAGRRQIGRASCRERV